MEYAAAPTMLAVIVNYRTASLTIDCLASLDGEVSAYSGLQAIVVDNASGDGSADRIDAAIRDNGWEWARLIRSPVNGGFGAGNNLAIRAALDASRPPDFLWLLNPDTVVRPGSAAALLRFMAGYARVGIAGTALLLEDGSPWPIAFRFPSIASEVERGARLGPVSRLLARHAVARTMPPESTMVDWVSGASLVVRRTMIEQVGLFDEAYFLYYEETDFCLQARRGGWECWYVPEAIVLHIAGQSTGVTARKERPDRVPAYWFKSRSRYFVKNHGRLYAAIADIGWIVTHLLWRLRFRFRRGVSPDPDPPMLLRDFMRHSTLMPRRSAATS